MCKLHLENELLFDGCNLTRILQKKSKVGKLMKTNLEVASTLKFLQFQRLGEKLNF